MLSALNPPLLPGIRIRPFRGRILVCAAAAILLCFSACGKHGTGTPQGATGVTPAKMRLQRPVEVTPVEKRELLYEVKSVGYLEADETPIASGVAGIVDEVLFQEGKRVEKGALLVTIAQVHYESEVKIADSIQKRAEHAVELAKDAVKRTQKIGTGGVTEEERVRAALGLELAKADLEKARAEKALSEDNLRKSKVVAPISGQINQRKVQTRGQYVKEETVIATIADLSTIRLVGWIPEKASRAVRKRVDEDPEGMTVRFELLAFEEGEKHTFQAKVYYMSTTASPDTHMFEFKAKLTALPKELEKEIKPGNSARIWIPLKTNPNANVVPETALRYTEAGTIVFIPKSRINKEGKEEWFAKASKVKIGYEAKDPSRDKTKDWVEIISSDDPLKWIVGRGADSLEDGTPIVFTLPEEKMKLLREVK